MDLEINQNEQLVKIIEEEIKVFEDKLKEIENQYKQNRVNYEAEESRLKKEITKCRYILEQKKRVKNIYTGADIEKSKKKYLKEKEQGKYEKGKSKKKKEDEEANVAEVKEDDGIREDLKKLWE